MNHSKSELPFKNLKKLNNVAVIAGSDFHIAVVYEHLHQGSESRDIGAFCDGDPLAQELIKRASASAT